MSFNLSEAPEFARIYSVHGLEEMIKDAERDIKVKENDRVDVLAGKKWNPLMKDGIVAQLDQDILYQRDNIKVYKEAFRIKLAPSGVNDARSRGDGCEVCIDGRIQVEGGSVICDCKLPEGKPLFNAADSGTVINTADVVISIHPTDELPKNLKMTSLKTGEVVDLPVSERPYFQDK
jgi:hypothetical protein